MLVYDLHLFYLGSLVFNLCVYVYVCACVCSVGVRACVRACVSESMSECARAPSYMVNKYF